MAQHHYSVTLSTKGPNDAKPILRTMQIFAKNSDDAQEKIIEQCEQNGIVHGNIVAIIKHPIRG